MITVMGATGNTGKAVAQSLLQKGEKVRAVARSREKLATLQAAGAELAIGDVQDLAFLTSALRGAEAAYVLMPPSPQEKDFRAYQDRLGETITRAIEDSGVKKVVFLSSLGADLPSGTGPVAGLHAQEARLRTLTGVDVLVLRPTYFAENLFGSIPAIKHQGVNVGAFAGNTPLPLIATQDIAVVAVEALRKRDFSGFVVRELLGARDYTHDEITSILGRSVGKPDLKYMQVPYAAFAQALTQFGLSADLARMYAELAQSFNEGRIKSLAGRGPTTTTPTSLEAFAERWAAAYKA